MLTKYLRFTLIFVKLNFQIYILHLQLCFRLQIRRASYLKAQVELAPETSRLKVS